MCSPTHPSLPPPPPPPLSPRLSLFLPQKENPPHTRSSISLLLPRQEKATSHTMHLALTLQKHWSSSSPHSDKSRMPFTNGPRLPVIEHRRRLYQSLTHCHSVLSPPHSDPLCLPNCPFDADSTLSNVTPATNQVPFDSDLDQYSIPDCFICLFVVCRGLRIASWTATSGSYVPILAPQSTRWCR